jgi:DNA-binding HxlR family transcriptional regulator
VRSYGQYCPIARTSELLAERWTPILIRNLLAGCRTFGELMDGAPGISKALLAQRLELFERHGLITKETADPRRSRCYYELTEKGRELKAITDAMGTWGARWLEVEPPHVNPTYVLWATCKLVDVELVPETGLVVRFDLADEPNRRLWMLLRRPYAEICSTYLGWEEDLIVRTDSETLAHWHLRHITYEDATRTGRLRIEGNRSAIRTFLRCLRPSPFAGTQPAKVLEPNLASNRGVGRTDIARGTHVEGGTHVNSPDRPGDIAATRS